VTRAIAPGDARALREGRTGYGRWRRATQLAVAAVFVALPLANASGHAALLGSLASLRLGFVDLVEPAAALTTLLAGGRAASLGAILLGAAPLALLALALGPVLCGWLCPFGLLSEGVDRLRRRPRWDPAAHVRLRVPRAVVLAAVFALSALCALPLGALLQGPRAVTVAVLEGLYLGAVSPFAASVLGTLLALDLLLPRRLFCRALCPAGSVANLLRTPFTLRVAHAAGRCRCTGDAACLTRCPWGVDPRRAARFDGCASCLACVDACPAGALSPTWLRPAPHDPPGLPFPRNEGDTIAGSDALAAQHDAGAPRRTPQENP
jgi:ferredoxin-type protein NapH